MFGLAGAKPSGRLPGGRASGRESLADRRAGMGRIDSLVERYPGLRFAQTRRGWGGFVVRRSSGRGGLEVFADVDASAGAAFAVDELAAVLGAHPGTEPELAGSLDLTAALGVMGCHRKSAPAVVCGGGLPGVIRGATGGRGLVHFKQHRFVDGVAPVVSRPQRQDVRARGKIGNRSFPRLICRIEDKVSREIGRASCRERV